MDGYFTTPLVSSTFKFREKMNKLCKWFGHKMRFVNRIDVAGPTYCARSGCGHSEPGIEWPTPPRKCSDYEGGSGSMDHEKHMVETRLKNMVSELDSVLCDMRTPTNVSDACCGHGVGFKQQLEKALVAFLSDRIDLIYDVSDWEDDWAFIQIYTDNELIDMESAVIELENHIKGYVDVKFNSSAYGFRSYNLQIIEAV